MANSGESPAPADSTGLRGSIDPNASIHLRIWRIAQEFGAITKDGKMAQEAGGYGYTTIDAMLARARTLFDRHGVLTIPRVTKWTQDGNRTVQDVDVDFVNVDCPDDKITIPVVGYGNDKHDKGPPKAHTQAIKIAIKGLLNLTTKEDEEDANTPEHQAAGSESEQVQAANERARSAVGKWASAYKAALTTARSTKELDQIKRANAAQLNDKDLPEVTWAFLDDLYKQRFEALEKIDVAQ